jgi:hypothetical protein
MLESSFANGPIPLLMQKARYILILRPALGRLRLPKPPRPFLVLHRTCLPALLTVTLFRHSLRRSFLRHTRQGRTRAPRRLPPLRRRITTPRGPNFRVARMEVEWAVGMNNNNMTRIRCRTPTHMFRVLMKSYSSHIHNHGRPGRHHIH